MEEYPVSREYTASKLPTYRSTDLSVSGSQLQLQPKHAHAHAPTDNLALGLGLAIPSTTTSTSTITSADGTTNIKPKSKDHHIRNHSASSIATPKKVESPKRRLTLPSDKVASPASPPSAPLVLLNPAVASASSTPAQKARNFPVAHSRNGLENSYYPPRSFITQRSMKDSSTTDWVAQQSIISTQPASSQRTPTSSTSQPSASVSDPTARPLIKPIRGFKPSSRKSTEMASRRISIDTDNTLRALEGYNNSQRASNQPDQDEHNSDDSDLFLRAAREEELARRASNPNGDGLVRSDSRKSRVSQRASMPPSSTQFHHSTTRRRGSDEENPDGSRSMDDQAGVGQVLTYRQTRDRPTALDEINRSRYIGGNSRSNPTTPRNFGSREISPESQAQYGGGRRPSVPDATLPARNYRQSNLSYSTPRTYNSSPLVSRTTDMHETTETPRGAEGTESTVSTTAPSTVWDELEDLKSRIHRLELTGKLPPTSGAAMSRASNERPATATTTVTTMSSSPKRGRGNSISPVEPVEPISATEAPPAEVHPLLHAALAKSKPLLNPEVFKTLEATASDALAIASMMGSSGQPGPISSSQSTIGGVSSVSDRQVRRKADSLCRSLTELCLALSEGKSAPPIASQPAAGRGSDETEIHPEPSNTQRQLVTTDLARAKSSPRALSRLEARRSSLLATSTLSNPRYTPSEAGTPTQTSMAGRRTSLLLRSRRGGTEEPEEEVETRFRAPSRANTEIGRMRNSPREYTSQQPLPDRAAAIQSSLPVRRHYVSTSLTNPVVAQTPPVSGLGGRRYLDRNTPERDTTSVIGRFAEERVQRKSSIGQGFSMGRAGSLTRRTRQPTIDSSAVGQGGYQ